MHGCSLLRLLRILLHNDSLTVSPIGLHSKRTGQRIAAEQRQPNGQNYCNEFSGETEHVRSMAKLATSVKRKLTPPNDNYRLGAFAALAVFFGAGAGAIEGAAERADKRSTSLRILPSEARCK